MTRDVVLAVWAVVALVFVAGEALSVATRRRTAGIATVLRRLAAGRVRRVALFVGWMWLGWHFFAR